MEESDLLFKNRKYKFVYNHSREMANLSASAIELSKNILEDGVGSLNSAQINDLTIVYENAKSMFEITTGILNADSKTMEKEVSDWDFLGFVSNDYRMYVNWIVAVPAMLKEDQTVTDKVQITHLDELWATGRKMYHLIDQFYNVWKIEKHRAGFDDVFWFEGCDLRESFEDFKFVNKNLPIDLPNVYADSGALKQSMVHLIFALREDTQESEIIIDAKFDGEWVTISIENTTFQLQNSVLNQLEKIRFYPTLFMCEEFGTALDLYISECLIKIQGGEMYMNEANRCTFTLKVN